MGTNRSGYMQEYYRKNKERILDQRKRRYASDDEYREKVNESRRLSRNIKSAPQIIQSAGVNTEEENMPVPTKMRVLHPEDKSLSAIVSMYTLGDAALAIGVEKHKIDHWVYMKKLPQPRYRNKSNWRLYTEDELDIIKRFFIIYRRKFRNNNYTFRLTKELSNKINEACGKLVGGLLPVRFEEQSDA
tara:strand:- start:328 stop:891 length:564 start_codon:yes stop_codon:yes gene_type:complete